MKIIIMSKQKKISSGENAAAKEKESEVKSSRLQDALDEIKQRFGEGAILQLDGIRHVDVDAIPTGTLSLDMALGVGGVPRGRIIEIFGAESTGKSTLALHIVAETQKKGGVAAFIDAEHALDPEYAAKIGVNIKELLISQPDSGEQALQIAEALVNSKAVDVIVVDSVAALTPQREIEGEIGDQHIGLQARLMSQAMRKLASIVAKTNTLIIFLNQTRMKIGIMFGCLNYKSIVNLSDGTTEWIGRIVDQKKNIKVISYDWKKDRMAEKKITGWYCNGRTDKFLQITAYKPYGNGRAQLACTTNHPILTPSGWRRAEDIEIGDKVLLSAPFRLSQFQWEIIRGSIMGDGNLSDARKKGSFGVRFRLGHSLKQKDYLGWKASLFKNIESTIYQNPKSIKFDLTALPELFSLKREVYRDGYKFFSPDFLSNLTPLSLAVWYMDDAHLDIRDQAQTKARIKICVKAIHAQSRQQIQELLRSRYDIENKINYQGDNPVLTFDQKNTEKFLSLIKRYVHPSMAYKLLPKYRGYPNVKPVFSDEIWKPIAVAVSDVKVKPKTRSMLRFDIGVRGTHNFVSDGFIVHNSPETTPGGMALKFYSSVRISLKRIAQIKKGDQIIGSRIKAQVVKNKVAAPFKSTELDLYYNEGFSKVADLINSGLKYGIVKKVGMSFQYQNRKLGQNVETVKTLFREDKGLENEIKKAILEKIKESAS